MSAGPRIRGDLNDGSLEGYVRSYAPAGDVVRCWRQFGACNVYGTEALAVTVEDEGSYFGPAPSAVARAAAPECADGTPPAPRWVTAPPS